MLGKREDETLITGEERESVVILYVTGSLAVESLGILERAFLKYEPTGKDVVLNLAGFSFMDSSVIGLLLVYGKRFEKEGRRIVLCNVNDDMYRVFSIINFERKMKIFNTLDQALKHLEKI